LKQRLHDLRHLSYMIILPLLHLVYRMLNHDRGEVYSLVTGFDRLIPFNKYFILPYMLWSLFIFTMMLYFFAKNRKVYFKVLLTMIISLLINYLIYSVFQTTVPRPAVLGADFWSGAVRFLYFIDNPYNCFPSGHVVTSFAVMYGIYRTSDIDKRVAFLGKSAVILITLSTLFLKQHTILDVLASILLAYIVMTFVELYNLNEIRGWAGRVLVLLSTRPGLKTRENKYENLS